MGAIEAPALWAGRINEGVVVTQTSAPVAVFVQEQVLKAAQAKEAHALQLESALESYRAALEALRDAYASVRGDFANVSQREIHAAFSMTRPEIDAASAQRRKRRPRDVGATVHNGADSAPSFSDSHDADGTS